jgi:hypothetical protein
MRMGVVGRFSPQRDPTLGAIVETARTRGHDVVVLDIATFVRGPCRFEPLTGRLWLGGDPVVLRSLDVLWLGPLPSASAQLASSAQRLTADAWDVLAKHQAARHALAWSIACCAEAASVPVLSSPTRARPFDHKPFQLAALAAAGIAVPPTIVSDRFPDVVDDDGCDARRVAQIHKPVIGGVVVSASSGNDLDGVLWMRQPRLTGRQLRVVVVDRVVVAAAAIELEEGCLDGRHSASPWVPIELAPAVSDVFSRCALVCGFDLCAIDAVDTIDGVVILDVNRTPQVMDLAVVCGVDIAGHCVDLLEARAQRSG